MVDDDDVVGSDDGCEGNISNMCMFQKRLHTINQSAEAVVEGKFLGAKQGAEE